MKCVVLGAGGFLGFHLCNRLKREGHQVIGVSRRQQDYGPVSCDSFLCHDLTRSLLASEARFIFADADEVYQLAGEVGGMGYIGNSDNDAHILANSSRINANVLDWCKQFGAKRIFFASSACVYPDTQGDGARESLTEGYFPSNAFAREKLFAEALYLAHARNYGMTIRIGRLHNTYGPCAPYRGDRAKSVMALCCKVAEAPAWGEIEVWGDGHQRRSFTYVDDAIEGIVRLMRSDCREILNIGSAQLVTINQLIETICYVADKQVGKKYVAGNVGVFGRNSDNTLILKELGWAPRTVLHVGLKPTYHWLLRQLQNEKKSDTVVRTTTDSPIEKGMV
ncbi:MAG TPA: NAD-dependent epimerase/dehydratase family protein [Xanthobacteraceae bacterium]|nr:NAD-dependent epimerase/dehydratase family protein [Xanthobacteraceae bacterium]